MKKTPEYFSISALRVFICSFFTMGIYDLYWAYKNWEVIKNYKQKKVNPVIRAWFFDIIFIGPLLLEINRDIKRPQKKLMAWGIAGYLTFFYLQSFFNLLLYTTTKTIGSYIAVQIVCFGLLFLSALCLIPIQIAINKSLPKTKIATSPWHKGEIATISAALVLLLMNIGTAYLEIVNLKHKRSYLSEENIGEVLGTTYRHVVGYAKVCENYGYEMKKYPLVFYDKYEQPLIRLSDKLLNINVTIPQAWNEIIPPKSLKKVLDNVEVELEDMRKGLIINTVADITNQPWQKIEWKEDYNKILSIKDVCEILDNNADFILLTDPQLLQIMNFQ